MSTTAPSFFIGSSSFFAVIRTTIKAGMISNFGQIRPWSAVLADLEHLEQFPYTYNWRNIVSTLAPSFFIESSSFLQVTKTTIKARMSSNFDRIPPLTAE